MTAASHQQGPAARPEPTIRSVRAALGHPEDRAAFQEELETTPLHQLGTCLERWALRARAYAVPDLVASVEESARIVRGERDEEELLTDDEARVLLPGLYT